MGYIVLSGCSGVVELRLTLRRRVGGIGLR